MTQTIFSHNLNNGLVLLAEPMEAVESVAFTFLLPAGSVNDPAHRAGLANLTNEMCLRGCGERNSRQFVEDLENLGVERSEGVSELHTNYRGATMARNLSPALEIFADLLLRPRFPEEELEPARQMALQELSAIEDEPAHKVMQELTRRHYPDPWGRPSQGDEQGLTETSLADIRDCWRRLYRPNGTVLGVAGRFDWESLKKQVDRLFGDWAPIEPVPLEEGQRGPRHEHLHHESQQTQVAIAYESVPYRHPDYYQAAGAVGVLSGGMSARLFTEVREKRGLCYTVYATMHSLYEQGCVMCYAGTSAERAQETLDVTLSELRRLRDGIEQHELNRLKARVKSSLIMQQESSSARSGSIARDWSHLGFVRTMDEIAALIDGLTCESIGRFLEEHPPQDFTIVTLGPQELKVP